MANIIVVDDEKYTNDIICNFLKSAGHDVLQAYDGVTAITMFSDDVDLMSEYTSNRASLMTYKTSDVMLDLLLDLFYYTGYADNAMGVPNLNTRKWFNFVACDAIITLVDGQKVNVSDEIQRELIGIWNSGVTVLHKVDGFYDMDQVKENAEVSIEDL